MICLEGRSRQEVGQPSNRRLRITGPDQIPITGTHSDTNPVEGRPQDTRQEVRNHLGRNFVRRNGGILEPSYLRSPVDEDISIRIIQGED